MGYTSLQTQGLIAPAYLAAFICCLGAAWFSNRYGKRGFVVAGFTLVGTVGYLLLAVIQSESQVHVRYSAIYLAYCGIFPALSINMTWLLNNQGGDSKRGAGLALLATFGQCSSFVGSVLFTSIRKVSSCFRVEGGRKRYKSPASLPPVRANETHCVPVFTMFGVVRQAAHCSV
jgi:MFS family permease